jgi:hypothetical protein
MWGLPGSFHSGKGAELGRERRLLFCKKEAKNFFDLGHGCFNGNSPD